MILAPVAKERIKENFPSEARNWIILLKVVKFSVLGRGSSCHN